MRARHRERAPLCAELRAAALGWPLKGEGLTLTGSDVWLRGCRLSMLTVRSSVFHRESETVSAENPYLARFG